MREGEGGRNIDERRRGWRGGGAVMREGEGGGKEEQ
jgi:hypothetical protein